MFALFAGNTDEPLDGGGIDDLRALCPTLAEATDRLHPIVADDSGIDWAHVADLDLPGLPIVAKWNGRTWQVLTTPELSLHIDLDDSDEESAEDDELEAEIAELADLGRVDEDTADVLVLAEHRRSCDGPAAFGPFDTAAEAHEWVVQQYRTGKFDVDGCTVDYQVGTRR